MKRFRFVNCLVTSVKRKANFICSANVFLSGRVCIKRDTAAVDWRSTCLMDPFEGKKGLSLEKTFFKEHLISKFPTECALIISAFKL